jgi:hypothetical protein
MDSLAKVFWHEAEASTAPLQQRIEGELWALWLGDYKVSSDPEQAIIEFVNGRKALQYWTSKNSDIPLDKVDWEATKRAMQSVKVSRRHWVVQKISGFAATGRMMLRQKERETDACPRCGEPENAIHVLRCQQPEAQTVWNQAIDTLEEWLRDQKTQPGITEMIGSRLRLWFYQSELRQQVPDFYGLRATLEAQDQVGWGMFLAGRLVTGWADVQKRYLEWIGSQRSTKRWTVAVIKKLWDLAWDMWDHRNRVLHDNDQSLATKEIDYKIRAEFLLGSTGLSRSTKILY